jgi:hypothetical protein
MKIPKEIYWSLEIQRKRILHITASGRLMQTVVDILDYKYMAPKQIFKVIWTKTLNTNNYNALLNL